MSVRELVLAGRRMFGIVGNLSSNQPSNPMPAREKSDWIVLYIHSYLGRLIVISGTSDHSSPAASILPPLVSLPVTAEPFRPIR
jgi:hypothetical protein